MKLSEIASKTGLSIDTLDNLELGMNSAYDKYHKLIRFYGKNIKVILE